MGIGLIGVWNRAAVDVVYDSSGILIIAYMAGFVPYAGLIAASGISAVSPRMEEAAVMTGAGWGTIMRRVMLPLTRRHVAAACFVVFILSLGELGMTLLVIPPGRETIPVKIYNLMHYGAGELVAATCVVLVGIVLLLAGAFFGFQRRLDFARNAE
jgi:iron(III) transport system permease protein